MAATGRRFVVKVPLQPQPEKGLPKKRWMEVGYGTEVEGEFGTMILCTLITRPLRWDGEFAIFEKERKAPP